MASTFSPLLGIELMGVGDQNNTWGLTNNNNLGTLIEQAIAGSVDLDVTVGNIVLTEFDGASDQARNAVLRVIGTPGTARTITAPASSKLYIVANGSDASVTLKTSTSTGLVIPAGEVFLAYFDTTLLDFQYVGKYATSLNVANSLVLRDASGDFSAGTITANEFAGDLNGTINTATTAVTQSAGDNSTKVATTAYTDTAVTNATGSLGTMSTQNANNVTITGGTISGINVTATNIANTGGWSVTPSGTTLYFSYNGTNVAKIDSSGNLILKADVTAYGTV